MFVSPDTLSSWNEPPRSLCALAIPNFPRLWGLRWEDMTDDCYLKATVWYSLFVECLSVRNNILAHSLDAHADDVGLVWMWLIVYPRGPSSRNATSVHGKGCHRDLALVRYANLFYQTCSLGLRVLTLPPDVSIQVLPYLQAKSCTRNCRNLPPNFFTLSQSSFSMNSRPLSDALDWHG